MWLSSDLGNELHLCLGMNTIAKLHFTKGSSFENITDDEAEAVMKKLNHRPRKTLTTKHLMRYFFTDSLQEVA